MTLLAWLFILLLILVNALYVAAEFSVVSVRRVRVRQLAAAGNRPAARLLPILEDPQQLDRYIAACQIGITLSSLVLGAYSQATIGLGLAPLLSEWTNMPPLTALSVSALTVLIGLTALQVVLGELVPKSLALQYPTETALATLWPLRASLALYTYSGFIGTLNGSGLALLRLLGVAPTGHRHIHRPEEIDLLIADSRDGGLLEREEHLRLHRTLKLGVLPVRQLMVPRVHMQALALAATPEQFRDTIVASSYSRLPVYEDVVDNVVGVVHVKDVVAHYLQSGRMPTVREVMRPVVIVPESMLADELLRVFREQRSQQAIVSDEFGGVSGLVTLEDVLAEVLGDVTNEWQATGQPEPEKLPDGRVRLPGLMRLEEAATWTGVHWQSGANTVAGHIMHKLGHLPSVGQRATVDGLRVEIEQVDFHTISSVLITPLPEQEGAGE